MQNIQLKDFADLEEELREGMGLNREARSLYTITLRAADNTGLEIFTSVSVHVFLVCKYNAYVQVTLRVLDVNDNSPEFPSELVLFEIPENETAPYPVDSVQASDLDDGKHVVCIIVTQGMAVLLCLQVPLNTVC